MTQDTTSADAEVQAGQTPDSKKTDLTTLPPDVQEYIKTLREEAKQHRLEKQAEADERKRQETQRLEESNQWKEAAQSYKQQLEEAERKASRVDDINTQLREAVDARVAALPEQWRALVPEYDDPLQIQRWLDRNANVIAARSIPRTDAGNTGDASAAVPKSVQSALATAQELGMSAAEQAEFQKFLLAQQKR